MLSLPYIVIPKLIKQPTWGGSLIVEMKGWSEDHRLKNLKIGQSYELFSGSKLSLDILDSADPNFYPEVGNPDTDSIEPIFSHEKSSYFDLEAFIEQDPEAVLGSSVFKRFKKMPLLNKLTQAYGNSFQIHIRSGVSHPHWQAKPESWYYLADGLATFGLRKGMDVAEYKNTCRAIEKKMNDLSSSVKTGTMSIEEARIEAKKFISDANPWQFVNSHTIKKHSLLDLSLGAVHHSWEEDKQKFPDGNFLYEVQLDVMDPVSTIRSFDQGKIKDDGSVRQIQVNDYFALIDTNFHNNDIQNAVRVSDGRKLLRTPYYAVDILDFTGELVEQTDNSFAHLFVRDGQVDVLTSEGSVHITQGHSCLVPNSALEYRLVSSSQATIVKTFIE